MIFPEKPWPSFLLEFVFISSFNCQLLGTVRENDGSSLPCFPSLERGPGVISVLPGHGKLHSVSLWQVKQQPCISLLLGRGLCCQAYSLPSPLVIALN